MLKVIAEDFIKPEYIETVLPWYRELISATKKSRNALLMTSILMKRSGAFYFYRRMAKPRGSR